MAKNKFLGMMLVLLLGFTAIIGCQKDGMENNPEIRSIIGLDAEMEYQLKHDLSEYFGFPVEYIKFNDSSNSTWYYFGNYNGCVVVAFEGDLTVSIGIFVEDIEFGFSHFATMLAWKQDGIDKIGKFYTLQDAFNLGFLTKNDLESIYEQYLINYVNRNK